MNVRSWKQSKLADITNEMKESGLGIMAVTQTTLRGPVEEVSGAYKFIGKGRNHFRKSGGGILG